MEPFASLAACIGAVCTRSSGPASKISSTAGLLGGAGCLESSLCVCLDHVTDKALIPSEAQAMSDRNRVFNPLPLNYI